MDVVAKQGADIGSDHSLVLATLKLKLRKTKRKDQRSPPLDINKLRNQQIKRALQLEVRSRFTVLADEKDEIDMQDFNEILLETGKQLLGQRKGKHGKKEELISDQTWQKVEKRKERKRKRTYYQGNQRK